MKKTLIACTVVVSMFFAGTSYAKPTTCSEMSIVSVASVPNGSGAQVWLKNETSAPCGSVAAGSQKLFNLPEVNSDKTLALILTAVSLGKNMWVTYEDAINPGMIQIMSMQN